LVLLLDGSQRLVQVVEEDGNYGAYLLPFLKGLLAGAPGVMLTVALTGDRAEQEGKLRELFDVCTVLAVEPMNDEAARALLEERGGGALVFSPAVAARVNALAGGHPRLLLLLGQALARILAAAQRNLVVGEHVDTAGVQLASEQIAAYTIVWADLPAKGKLALALLAELPAGATDEKMVEICHERQAPVLEEELRRIVLEQVRSGRIVERAEGGLDFAAGLLRAWIARHHPFSVAVAESRDFVGPYQVLSTLGEGGMGVVYKARDMIGGQVVALKVMAKHMLKSREAHKRFLREADLGMKLKHPGIVRMLARGEHAGHGYIAMEYLEGRTLRQRIKEGGAIGWKETAQIGVAVAEALGEVHRMGIVHRDVKTENVMLAVIGKREVPKLMDFGLAHRADMSQLTRTGKMMGTIAYVAPEQMAGSGDEASPSWDLYALGSVLYEMLVGDVPFSGRDTVAMFKAIAQEAPQKPSERGATVPEKMEALVLQLLAKQAEERPATAEEVAERLREIVLGI
jgi:tRNA A-37 threonylcarbamoyl transferase component Bud32